MQKMNADTKNYDRNKIRMSENSRCVIVMTNLAFAPDGRKRKGIINGNSDMRNN